MRRLASLALSCSVLLACQPEPEPEPETLAKPADTAAPDTIAPDTIAPDAIAPDTAKWKAFSAAFLDDFFTAHPAFAVVAGRHEHDGRLPDWSAEGIAAEVGRLQGLRKEALAFGDAQLDETGRFERDLIVARIDRDLFWLDTAKWPFRNPAFYFDWLLDGLDPAVYATREYAPLDQRMKAYVAYAEAVPVAAKQIEANLAGPLPPSYIHFGVAGFSGLASYYRDDVPGIFAAVEDPELKAQFLVANTKAAEAMDALAAFLDAKRTKTGNGEGKDQAPNFALGPELFAQMVTMTEGVDVDLDALEAAGRADLQRNLLALEKACQALTPDQPVPDCVAKVAADKPEGGAIAGATRQLTELRAFLDANKLVTIPSTELATVAEAPPYMRQNSAYIDIPGPYERGLPSTYFISPPDPAWSPKEQAAYIPGQADLMFTSVHEVWPGHFLQYLHANRSSSELARAFVGYAYSEGWAHYSEEMMCEQGLCEGAPDRQVGQLLNALLRNVRFLSAIGLHARGMSVEESEAMFREQAYQDAGTARQQAARGTYDPGYLNYTLGKLMILKLRADWMAKTKAEGQTPADLATFHDTFLSFGGPPVPMVRAAMLGPDAGPAL